MKKSITIAGMFLALLAGYVLAHHPAEDIVDEEIYALIDAMVADTPHADLTFDDDMGTTTIMVDSVSAAEDLIADGLLAGLSLLDDDVTVTITFGDSDAVLATRNAGMGKNTRQWHDWGRPVDITIDRLLKEED